MGMRMYGITKYQIEHSKDCIKRELEDSIIDIFQDSKSGYITEDETFGEIDAEELLSIIEQTEDSELKKALQFLYNESSKDSEWDGYVRFTIY